MTAQPPRWRTTRFALELSRPCVMGIVNVSPDSFADDVPTADAAAALRRCEALLREGAALLDIGGESTRPGAPPLPADEEMRRLRPVLQGALRLGVPVSVDTRRAEVMAMALDLGVDIVNDVQALQAPGALALLARHGQAGVCLMHMRGEPATMSALAGYADVVAEVRAFLAQRLQAALDAGIAAERIVLDPGYGFAKRAEHSWALLAGQVALLDLGRPLLVGLSRKGFLGRLTGRAAAERGAASVAAALAAADRGARVLRVHDVAATVDALAVWQRLREEAAIGG
ncbi:MAG: dihydropteroate synthase [Rubrivivax sp.]